MQVRSERNYFRFDSFYEVIRLKQGHEVTPQSRKQRNVWVADEDPFNLEVIVHEMFHQLVCSLPRQICIPPVRLIFPTFSLTPSFDKWPWAAVSVAAFNGSCEHRDIASVNRDPFMPLCSGEKNNNTKCVRYSERFLQSDKLHVTLWCWHWNSATPHTYI